MRSPTPLVERIRSRENGFAPLLALGTGTAPARGGKFDNRPTWDNVPNPFDNRPTWDNWNKK
ncbi:hypothetical protein GCM10022243_09680 [Saccharothrix violaceirubra]|uniref:Uncharacterized protein n=1 Tax=Saccharothrix violaceirubra TaxID=413306 RepID=A0A7W7T6N8_9PSEU|nr:multiple cyclophane-containing RiPP AmcA [Saccharothrix violaceirubra]MBB4966195.1 hypothetical protein [Saccharothrix violaceirubra]